jgi:probable addiction module antidote protein
MATANYNDGLLERLQEPAYASEYLNEALKEGSQELFMLALRDVARAKGMTNAARQANLNRETLYRMLSEKGNPNLSSLSKLLDTFGLTLAIKEKETAA